MTDATDWLQPSAKHPAQLQLTVHVQPSAKNTACAGIHGDALKIRLAAPPVDGKANAALIVWLARTLAVPQNTISLLRGQTNRRKVLVIDATTPATADALRHQLLTLAQHAK